MKIIKLIIIEDNKLLRDGIRAMLNGQKDIQVLGALGDKVKVHDKIRDLKPNVLLLDLGLANQNSLDLVKSLKKQFPELKTIVMDLLPIQSDIVQFIECGVSGFILKDATSEDFINTIRKVAEGEKVFPPQQHGSLLSEIVDNAVKEIMDSKLIESIRMTENEKKIVKLVSSGHTYIEIAKKLQLDAARVKGHIDNILEKMSLTSRVQISVYKDSGGDVLNPPQSKDKVKKTKKTKQTFPRLTKFNQYITKK